MRFSAMMRVKNEARWIERSIRAVLPLCERVFILDDHSTDGTPEICSSYDQVTVWESPFEGLNETRDKQWLLNKIVDAGGADYVLAIDGDEELEPNGPQAIRHQCESTHPDALSLRVVYLWNDSRTWRSDGVYGRFYRPSLFRLVPGDTAYVGTTANGNMHCTNVPYSFIHRSQMCSTKLLHWGYVDPEIRARKIKHYQQVDPGNSLEDNYRHITQGDPGGVSPHKQLLHAGPLRLERL